jgi:hypothetical protein
MKKWLLFLFITIVASLVLGLSACSSSSSTSTGKSSSVNTPMATTPTTILSEQPDKATYQKYFSDMGLGKLPAGGQLPLDLQQNANVFTQGDQIGVFLSVIQEVQVRTAIYDTEAKKVVKEGGFPKSLTPSNYAGAEPLTIPAGKYEYKVYAGDVLVAVLPFEVLDTLPTNPSSQTTPQPSPTLSEQPDKETFQKYFLIYPAPMGIGKLLTSGNSSPDLQQNVTVFAIGDQITLYGNIIKECPQPRYAIYDVQTKKVVKEGGLSFPPPPTQSGFAVGFVSVDTLDIPVDKYEYKVYVSDVLVAVFPFEVR